MTQGNSLQLVVDVFDSVIHNYLVKVMYSLLLWNVLHLDQFKHLEASCWVHSIDLSIGYSHFRCVLLRLYYVLKHSLILLTHLTIPFKLIVFDGHLLLDHHRWDFAISILMIIETIIMKNNHILISFTISIKIIVIIIYLIIFVIIMNIILIVVRSI